MKSETLNVVMDILRVYYIVCTYTYFFTVLFFLGECRMRRNIDTIILFLESFY